MSENDGTDTVIRRRHVIYVEGYDPQGAEGYHGLFSYSFKRFLKNWPIQSNVGDLQIDSDDFAHWDIAAAGPNWRVLTRYEFLRQEQMIRANMAQPMWRQVPRALGWMLNYLYTGTLFRIYRASHQYGLALTHFQMLLLCWLAASALGGWLVASLAVRFVPMPEIADVRRSASRRRSAASRCCGRSPTDCSWCRSTATGRISCPMPAASRPASIAMSRPARTVLSRSRAPTTAEEIVVVGHSGGGVLAPAVVSARARARSRRSARTARAWCC